MEVQIPKELYDKLQQLYLIKRQDKSKVVAAALEEYFDRRRKEAVK